MGEFITGLSHTSNYLLSILDKPNINPDVRMWGSALVSAECRHVKKSDRIGQINRNNYASRVRDKLIHLVL